MTYLLTVFYTVSFAVETPLNVCNWCLWFLWRSFQVISHGGVTTNGITWAVVTNTVAWLSLKIIICDAFGKKNRIVKNVRVTYGFHIHVATDLSCSRKVNTLIMCTGCIYLTVWPISGALVELSRHTHTVLLTLSITLSLTVGKMNQTNSTLCKQEEEVQQTIKTLHKCVNMDEF